MFTLRLIRRYYDVIVNLDDVSCVTNEFTNQAEDVKPSSD